MAMQINQTLRNAVKIIGNGRQMSTNFTNKKDNVPEFSQSQKPKQIHLTSQCEYPQAAVLPLPVNIDPTETTRFSPQRSRDISGTCISIYADQSAMMMNNTIDITADNSIGAAANTSDPHLSSYDCNGAVSLNSVMQSNVPSPFGGMNKFTHLNMPGGQWEQSSKYMAYDLQSSHYTNLRREVREDWTDYNNRTIGQATPSTLSSKKGIFPRPSIFYHLNLLDCYANKNIILRHFSLNCNSNLQKSNNTNPEQNKKSESVVEGKPVTTLSRKDQLKKAVKEYGSTVIIFHVTISLMSLGTCYALVSSGLDVIAILEYFGLGGSTLSSKIGAGASTFVVSYAIHKVFAPVRISITLGATPFIVRYLRKRGILKPPKSTASTSSSK